MMVRSKPSVWEPDQTSLNSSPNDIGIPAWGWYQYGELLECVNYDCTNNFFRKNMPPFTAESMWDSFFALSRAWKDNDLCDSSQLIQVVDTVDDRPVVIAMFRKRTRTCQPLEKLWVPSGWGLSVIAAVNYTVVKVRLVNSAEFREGFIKHQVIKSYLNGQEVWEQAGAR